MHYLNVIWLRWLLAMMVAGIGLALALYLGFGRTPAPPAEEELEQYPAGIQMGRGPIPGLLVLIFVIVGCAMVGYLWHAWAMGEGF